MCGVRGSCADACVCVCAQNYPFWYPFVEEDKHSQFRFTLTFKH